MSKLTIKYKIHQIPTYIKDVRIAATVGKWLFWESENDEPGIAHKIPLNDIQWWRIDK